MVSVQIVLVGAGNMGGAMMRGWLAAGIEPASIAVIDPSPPPAMQETIGNSGVRHFRNVPADLAAAAVFLAIKPQMMNKVLPGLASLFGPDTLCISIAAGTTVATMTAALGDVAAVRAMPNTPAMIGRGITAAWPNPKVSDQQRAFAHQLLGVTGPVEWVGEEDLIDAVTALSGSGPAYVFYLAECMAEAGHRAGLDQDLAMRLARATVAGAGELLYRSEEPAARLRANVTSPGGTTAAALEVLMRGEGLEALLTEAIAAARKRAGELAE